MNKDDKIGTQIKELIRLGRGDLIAIKGTKPISLSDLESTQGLIENEKEMIKNLIIQGNKIFHCYFNKNSHVESLTLGVRGEISDCIFFPHLNTLTVSYKSPETPNFLRRHQSTIKFLNLTSNSLRRVPNLSCLTTLEELNLTRNRISEVNWFGNLTNLKRLILSQNNIKTLRSLENISACVNLEEIYLFSNEITDLCEFKPLTNFPRLENIVLKFNKIDDINITYDVPCLTHLGLINNKIKKITALKNLSNLKVLDLTNLEEDRERGWNELRSIENLENLPNLEKIRVNGNPVKNFSGLEKLPKLRYIGEIRDDGDYIYYGCHDYFKKIGFKMHRDREFIYKPEFPTLKRKINKYITLKLIRDEHVCEWSGIFIYVGKKLFRQCKQLLFQIPVEDVKQHEEIQSIDEAAELLRINDVEVDLSPEEELWGHSSNLEVWVEHNYDTRLLHRNLAFPLLKKLTTLGDPLAEKVFKEEIAKRYASGHPTVRKFLEVEGYLKYLSKEELKSLQ